MANGDDAERGRQDQQQDERADDPTDDAQTFGRVGEETAPLAVVNVDGAPGSHSPDANRRREDEQKNQETDHGGTSESGQASIDARPTFR